MTTIAFDGSSIAYDSYVTQAGVIVDNTGCKHWKIKGADFFFAGTVQDYEHLVSWFFDRSYEPAEDTDCSAIVVLGDTVFEVASQTDTFMINQEHKPMALGTGGCFALGAMDAGCSAKEAVKIACSRDVFSGGRVKEYRLKADPKPFKPF